MQSDFMTANKNIFNKKMNVGMVVVFAVLVILYSAMSIGSYTKTIFNTASPESSNAVTGMATASGVTIIHRFCDDAPYGGVAGTEMPCNVVLTDASAELGSAQNSNSDDTTYIDAHGVCRGGMSSVVYLKTIISPSTANPMLTVSLRLNPALSGEWGFAVAKVVNGIVDHDHYLFQTDQYNKITSSSVNTVISIPITTDTRVYALVPTQCGSSFYIDAVDVISSPDRVYMLEPTWLSPCAIGSLPNNAPGALTVTGSCADTSGQYAFSSFTDSSSANYATCQWMWTKGDYKFIAAFRGNKGQFYWEYSVKDVHDNVVLGGFGDNYNTNNLICAGCKLGGTARLTISYGVCTGSSGTAELAGGGTSNELCSGTGNTQFVNSNILTSDPFADKINSFVKANVYGSPECYRLTALPSWLNNLPFATQVVGSVTQYPDEQSCCCQTTPTTYYALSMCPLTDTWIFYTRTLPSGAEGKVITADSGNSFHVGGIVTSITGMTEVPVSLTSPVSDECPATCGNNIVEAGEQCDPPSIVADQSGNIVKWNSYCTEDCQLIQPGAAAKDLSYVTDTLSKVSELNPTKDGFDLIDAEVRGITPVKSLPNQDGTNSFAALPGSSIAFKGTLDVISPIKPVGYFTSTNLDPVWGTNNIFDASKEWPMQLRTDCTFSYDGGGVLSASQDMRMPNKPSMSTPMYNSITYDRSKGFVYKDIPFYMTVKIPDDAPASYYKLDGCDIYLLSNEMWGTGLPMTGAYTPVWMPYGQIDAQTAKSLPAVNVMLASSVNLQSLNPDGSGFSTFTGSSNFIDSLWTVGTGANMKTYCSSYDQGCAKQQFMYQTTNNPPIPQMISDKSKSYVYVWPTTLYNADGTVKTNPAPDDYCKSVYPESHAVSNVPTVGSSGNVGPLGGEGPIACEPGVSYLTDIELNTPNNKIINFVRNNKDFRIKITINAPILGVPGCAGMTSLDGYCTIGDKKITYNEYQAGKKYYGAVTVYISSGKTYTGVYAESTELVAGSKDFPAQEPNSDANIRILIKKDGSLQINWLGDIPPRPFNINFNKNAFSSAGFP